MLYYKVGYFMKKLIVFLALVFGLLGGYIYAATLTDPVVDLGTITYTSSTLGVWTFTVTGGNSSTMSGSGTGATWTGGVYTPLHVADLQKYGTAKYAHVRVDLQSPDAYTDSNCGTLAITNIYVKPPYGGVYSSFPKKSGNPTYINGYQNGDIYFSFTATVTPLPDKGTCTITKTYPNFVHFAEGSSSEPTSGYQDSNITFSVTLVMPETTTFSHDEDAALNFGTICRFGQAQTLTITPAGTVGGPNVACPVSADISSDSFTVSSASATSISVSLPSTVTLNNGGNSLSVTNLTSSCSGGCSVGAGGSTSFGVGGTLTVPANAPVGNYTGTYSVTVTY